jgi:hypothetical protein
MKILLLHFEDDPEAGPWATLCWDRIVDLGLAGKNSYDRWKLRFGCPVTTLQSLSEGFEDFRRVRDLLGLGGGHLTDQHGLDWWEIMSILLHGEMETLILLQRFALTVGADGEVHISRPGIHASILQCLLGARVHVFHSSRQSQKSGLRHYLKVSRKLSTAQLADVFWDKYDAGYQLRGRLTRSRTISTQPVVLLPTAYINVSRTGLAYANSFPSENFLLVATRRSGWVENPPPNVGTARLSFYASLGGRDEESAEIENRWQSLRGELTQAEEFAILDQLGYLKPFSRRFRHGLEVRDAWRNVLDREPVQGVLCADDSNPYTRIPLLLAKFRGLPNIACHHGALDGRYVFKRTYGDVIWVKGKMEKDYLARKCSVPDRNLEIAAPAFPESWNQREHSSPQDPKDNILLVSEVFEAGCGRPEEFYRDIVPRLADMALANRRTLVVKLHPAESKSERSAVLVRILSPEQKKVTRIVTGPLNEDLLSSTWFAVTILSTAAMECALRGIPCFLCKWLESWPYGYVEQFIRFGVGIGLNDPVDLETIPEYLRAHPVGANAMANYWQAANPDRLRDLLASSRSESVRALS